MRLKSAQIKSLLVLWAIESVHAELVNSYKHTSISMTEERKQGENERTKLTKRNTENDDLLFDGMVNLMKKDNNKKDIKSENVSGNYEKRLNKRIKTT